MPTFVMILIKTDTMNCKNSTNPPKYKVGDTIYWYCNEALFVNDYDTMEKICKLSTPIKNTNPEVCESRDNGVLHCKDRKKI
jgi:hypothetical protein